MDCVDSSGQCLLAGALVHACADHCGMHFLVIEVYGFHPLEALTAGIWGVQVSVCAGSYSSNDQWSVWLMIFCSYWEHNMEKSLAFH